MFQFSHENPFQIELPCLIVGLLDKPLKFEGVLGELDEAFQGQLTELVKTGDLSAKYKSVQLIHTFGFVPAKRILFVGLGKEKELTIQKLKMAFGKAAKYIKNTPVQKAAIALDTFITDKWDAVQAAVALGEAVPLSTYEFRDYKQKPNLPEPRIEEMTVYSSHKIGEIEQAAKAGYILGKATNSARTLVNMPSNLLTPSYLASYASQLAEKYGLEVEILGKSEIEKLGMGAFLAVNQGSKEEPKMITLKYQGKEKWEDVIGLIGKGITYDSGGYSLKTKNGLVGMKTDMAGAAAVLGAMEAIAEWKPKQNVVAVIPATDNVVSASAFRPDDVITSMNGKTIEVLNTDAEGRLVLADAVTYAKHHGAEYLVDVATLTGGVIVALGTDKTGAVTNDEWLFEQILEASFEAGEYIWRLPYTEEDKKRVRNSRIADLNNSPGREGHAIMGAAFIGEFVEGAPWVHLDIAGTADTDKDYDLGPAGATGVMTRTLALFVDRFDKE